MSNYQELVTILKELLTNRFYPKPEYIHALLGDGQGNVLVPDRPDYNYVRFSRGASETFEVFNKEVSQPVDGWPVLVGTLPWQPNLIQVVATDWSAYAQTGWGDSMASIQAHAPTHEWPNFLPGSDAINTYLRAITPMRTQAAASGSTSVIVTAYEYGGATGTNYGWPGLPQLALGDATPPTGSMRYMGVYLNPATNTLGVVSGSTTIYTDALEPERPAWPRGVYPSAYVRLYGGQAQINERDIRDARRLWKDSSIFTGTMAAATQAEVNTGTDVSKAVTPATLTNWKPDTVKNTSGATAAAGDVGYLDELGEYKTTTTAGLIANWCIVITGGANNSDITIAAKGRRTVNYTGSAPAQGDYLTTSTVAGSALAQAYVSPAIFAVCLAAGSGGTVEALLLCNTNFVPMTDSNAIYRVDNHSSTLFVATINGAPSATSVVYNAPSSGQEDCIVPQASTQLAKARLHNTTRGTYRLITTVNTGTNTITTVSSSDAWASGDTITIESQTVTSPSGLFKFVDLDLSQQTVIPILARALMFEILKQETGTATASTNFHPFETFASGKEVGVAPPPVANARAYRTIEIPLIQRVFNYRSFGSGTGTVTIEEMKLMGYWLAAP